MSRFILNEQVGLSLCRFAARMGKPVNLSVLLLLCSQPIAAAQLEVPGGYATIQAAINAAASGDIVNVAAGTYLEQLTITKPLTLQGAGQSSTIIQSPTAVNLTQSGGNWKSLKAQDVYAIIGVKLATAGLVTIKNLKVDGNDQGYLPDATYPDKNTYVFQGIGAYNSNLTVDSVTVTNVRELDSSYPGNVLPAGYLPADQPAGMNHNEGIFAESSAAPGTHTLTVTNSTVTKFQKTAIMGWGPGLVVDINNNLIQGYGKTLWSTGNGIQIGSSDRTSQGGANGDRRGTRGSITNNRILDLGLVIPTPGNPGSYLNLGLAGPSGILLWEAGSGVTISNNTITGPGVFSWHSSVTSNDGGFGNLGIDVYKSASPTITGNTVSGMDIGIEEENTTPGSNLTVSGNVLSNNALDYWVGAGNNQITLGSNAEVVTVNQSGNGANTLTNFGAGDAIYVLGFTNVGGVDSVNGLINGNPVVSFSGGTVSAGDGSNVAANSIQVASSGGNTTLYINTDGVSGSTPQQLTLAGTFAPANFTLGTDRIISPRPPPPLRPALPIASRRVPPRSTERPSTMARALRSALSMGRPPLTEARSPRHKAPFRRGRSVPQWWYPQACRDSPAVLPTITESRR